MYKHMLSVFVLAMSLALSATGFAASECHEGLKHMVDSLKLDDTQKQKIMPVVENLKASIKQSAMQMKDLSKQIDEQMTSDAMNQSVVNDLIDKKAKLIADMMKAKIMAKNQIYVVLNPQQKTEWRSMMQKMKDKMDAKFKGCHDSE